MSVSSGPSRSEAAAPACERSSSATSERSSSSAVVVGVRLGRVRAAGEHGALLVPHTALHDRALIQREADALPTHKI